ncbi:MAG: D-tyrosyl-tRNA(Tyr) deacylase [Waddliaceae bacterium]|jgi:D-aminoacyl-tRNA deacylase|nr:D-tyrosyl-tRNA(Tyr) deacylase [Waddliaceae bacterium]MBT3578968.1 D-tyrosyl-tRNA(Tyr) deacylase [Waddliaceae bacterium]MBT4445099.1 D-tyrosyl-tRNA(Tyr) deacylase [Waddliaceae bacterium]MBT6928964.1 D-tyrosyl-tRNA(Tyr) deacylase [Waddliaceae bacterium]MBT7264540.1 D-tyrosyl-tRNA(Tyr) deacylase [Waddliaceae bacterium]
MKVLIQRVKEASVTVDGKVCGSIGGGLLIFFAAHIDDTNKTIPWLSEKVVGLRIFPDDAGKMNISVSDIDGEILVVSQFTLYGTCSKGKRPEFTKSAPPEKAEALYDEFVEVLTKKLGKPVSTGKFREHMDVSLINDGPITLEIEKK